MLDEESEHRDVHFNEPILESPAQLGQSSTILFPNEPAETLLSAQTLEPLQTSNFQSNSRLNTPYEDPSSVSLESIGAGNHSSASSWKPRRRRRNSLANEKGTPQSTMPQMPLPDDFWDQIKDIRTSSNGVLASQEKILRMIGQVTQMTQQEMADQIHMNQVTHSWIQFLQNRVDQLGEHFDRLFRELAPRIDVLSTGLVGRPSKNFAPPVWKAWSEVVQDRPAPASASFGRNDVRGQPIYGSGVESHRDSALQVRPGPTSQSPYLTSAPLGWGQNTTPVYLPPTTPAQYAPYGSGVTSAFPGYNPSPMNTIPNIPAPDYSAKPWSSSYNAPTASDPSRPLGPQNYSMLGTSPYPILPKSMGSREERSSMGLGYTSGTSGSQPRPRSFSKPRVRLQSPIGYDDDDSSTDRSDTIEKVGGFVPSRPIRSESHDGNPPFIPPLPASSTMVITDRDGENGLASLEDKGTPPIVLVPPRHGRVGSQDDVLEHGIDAPSDTSFSALAKRLEDTRHAQLVSVDQQREMMRYMRRLSEWLERDVEDRQREIRTLGARTDQLRNDLMGQGQFAPKPGWTKLEPYGIGRFNYGSSLIPRANSLEGYPPKPPVPGAFYGPQSGYAGGY